MVFWMFSYKELTHAGSNSVGMFVLFAQFVHVVIMGDFFYYYAIRSGNCICFFYFASFFLGLPMVQYFFPLASAQRMV